MKNYLSIVVFSVSLLLAGACTKENSKVQAETVPANEPSAIIASGGGMVVTTGCYPMYRCNTTTIFADCLVMFPPDDHRFPDPWLVGRTYLDEKGHINMQFDASQEFANNSTFEGIYSFSNDITIPQEVIAKIYTNTEFAPPTGEVIIRAGNYPLHETANGYQCFIEGDGYKIMYSIIVE
jgi:hypothetical protein